MKPSFLLTDKAFRILAQSSRFLLGNIYEDAFLINKLDGSVIGLGDFYGDPTCAAIAPSQSWVALGGEDRLVVWYDGKVTEKMLNSPFDMRIHDEQCLEILTDPWSQLSAIWQLRIGSFDLIKVRDFPDYIHKEYQENVNW